MIFLDFDGHVVSGTAWNSGGASTYHARPFSSDSDYQSFSGTELAQIAEIWHRVAEDYAAFDVDVTTQEPAIFDNNTAGVVITPNTDANNTQDDIAILASRLG